MANKEYYERWLALKKEVYSIVAEDAKIHNMAMKYIGIKPQSNAVEVVSRIYAKYVIIYNKLCDIYDQMEQVQRRPFLKAIIDAITCRILDLKTSLEEIEVFEFTYPDNALLQLLITPDDIKIMCPFFYPFEIRSQELQYIVDEIFAGNRLGDPEPTPSELEIAEEERLEAERIKQEEKQAEILRKLAMGEEIVESIEEKQLNPVALELRRRHQEYLTNIHNIQRMERSRVRIKDMVHIKNKNRTLYLELAGLKKPPAREEIQKKSAELIMLMYRKFMEIKRKHHRENLVREKLGMVIPAWRPPSVKTQLEKVKETRREKRRQYYEDWLKKNLTEKARVMRLREGNIIEDITYEIKQWFEEWYFELKCFDEFPWPLEGGSILVVEGKTFSIEEYLVWKEEEEKRRKKEASNPKTKEQIKQEKLAAIEEIKKKELEAKAAEKKRIADYKKQRLNPDADPGCYVLPDNSYEPIVEAWKAYENQWRIIDRGDADDDVKRGYITQLITEIAYQDCQLELRPVVDDKMRLELKLLQKALKKDIAEMGENPPLIKKRKRPKPPKPPKPEKLKTEVMFQKLVDEGIIRNDFPKLTLDDFWGDRNYAAAELRAIPWTPEFPPPCIGDVREQVRVRCLLALGSTCTNVAKAQLIVGHKNAGKRTLIYAVASETNSILIDFSPFNVYNKCLGAKKQKQMFIYAAKIAKIMQPTVIMVANADKLFYKKVPKEEKSFNPTRLSKDFYKEVIKPIGKQDRILVLGTASEPWLAKSGLSKIFHSVILCPRTDYASISLILNHVLTKYHGVDRLFNVHSVAQVLKGYDINSIRKIVENVLTPERIGKLYHKPLAPQELVDAALAMPDAICIDEWDGQIYKDWYSNYSAWGAKFIEYMAMLASQLKYYLKKQEKQKKKKK